MPRTPCTQSDRSLLQLVVTSALAVGTVVCAVSSAYAFSVGPLPGLNCGPGAPLPIPCDLAPVLRQYQEVHQLITDDALSLVGFTPPSGQLVRFRIRLSMEIEDGNARTDYNQGNHSWHFDNAYLKQGGERLIKGKQSLLEKLWNPSTMSVAQAKDLRLVFGSYLHTQQDFYAHSNYINLSDPPGIQLGDAVPPPQPALPYPCNLLSTTSLSDAGKRNLLTTAYAIPPLDAADAPIGQCAHGLVQLGIHKDWAGRAGHKEAYDSAVAASIRFADSIINDPSNNPDNVCMLMTDEPCQNSNPWVGTWSGTTTSTCGYYSGPITNTITSGGGNTLIISNFATTYTASYSGNTATSTTIGSVVLTLSGDTMTVSYPPACQTATLTRQ